jgi:polyisoprenoid-binding protein YceI
MKLIASTVLAFSMPLFAAPLKIKSSAVVFEANVPNFFDIPGEGGKLTSDLQTDGKSIWGEVEVNLADFETGMSLRDDHMLNKYLQVKKYPKAKLIVDRVAMTSKTFSGILAIKKDAKPVKGKLLIEGNKLKASFKIQLGDFPSIGVPSWKGKTVADEVTVEVSATLIL